MDFAKYVKLRHEKFGAVVFDTLNEKVYVTNETGKAILSLLAEGLNAEEIAQRLGKEYEEGGSAVDCDVAEFIDGLQSAGLLASPAEQKS